MVAALGATKSLQGCAHRTNASARCAPMLLVAAHARAAATSRARHRHLENRHLEKPSRLLCIPYVVTPKVAQEQGHVVCSDLPGTEPCREVQSQSYSCKVSLFTSRSFLP